MQVLPFLLPIVYGCLPVHSPDDMTEITTVAATTPMTTADNSMCQLCPSPYDCSMVPTGAFTCDSVMMPTVMRGATGCTIMFTCNAGYTLWVLETNNMWTQLAAFNSYSGACDDANPVWICDGRPVQRIVCAQ